MRDHSRQMNQCPGWTPKRVTFYVAITLVVAMSLIGCDLGPDAPVDASSASATVTLPLAVSHRGPLLIQVDPDITGSYPTNLRHAFLAQTAAWIDTIPRVNAEQASVYISYIDHEPYLPFSSPLSFTIAAVPDWPVLQQTPVPSCPKNPYSCSDAQATATTSNNASAVRYQQQLKNVQAQLATVQHATQQQTVQLRVLRPATDWQATSIYGVLNLASQRFSGVNGEKYLIVGSDLANNTNADAVLPDLKGVHFIALDFYCTSAVECQQTKATWTRILERAHVASITFLEPEQSQTAASPWN